MKLKFFNLAKKVSKKSISKHQLGCVIVDKNKVITTGFNDTIRTHPKTPDPYQTLHAEISAVLGVPKHKLKGCTAYVYRETKDGNPANSKPCETCEEVLRKMGIKRVYYTDSDGYKEFKP